MEIRTLQQSPAELSAFVNNTWRTAYAGRMAFPLWTPEYFDWQLRMDTPEARHHLLGVYDGDRLAGVLSGCRLDLRIDERPHAGLLSSWLTIDPEYRGRGLVPQLKDEQARRLHDEGGELILSYRYHGTRDSLADRPARQSDEKRDYNVRWIGLWARLLDPERAIRWQLSRADRWLSRAGRLLLRRLRDDDAVLKVRDIQEADLPACLELCSKAAADARLAIDWDRQTLRYHLMGRSVAHGLVACREGQIVGLMSFHLIPFAGRADEPLSVIDLWVVDQMRHREQVSFLLQGLARMKQAGAILALKMGLGDVRTGTMLDAGFVPRRRDSLQVLRWLNSTARTTLHGKQLVLWR